MFRITLPLLVAFFLFPSFNAVGNKLGAIPLFPIPDSTYFAVMSDFYKKGVPVNYKSNPSLFIELHQWLGFPHRRRGKEGIDCSGLVKAVYEKVYGITLTGSAQDIFRRTEIQMRDKLEEGDLLFFRIYSTNRIDHVGIYLGGGKFVHASSSRGVIVSNLDESYYRRHFAKAGRLKEIHFHNPSTAKDQ